MDAKALHRVKADIANNKSVCSNCRQLELCMPANPSSDLLKNLDVLVSVKRHIKSGDVFYHTGTSFQGLYAVKSGFMKIENHHPDGRLQINGFYMMGEIFGFDGIATNEHVFTAVAIEDSEICLIPYDRIEQMGQEVERLKYHFYRLMSAEISRNYTMMMMLGSIQSEVRLATFLLNLSKRLQMRGYSHKDLLLCMSREEIGNYLGMKLETVSRIFSKFQAQGLLKVHIKNIEILDMQLLTALSNQHSS
ncbi:MAG: helix-turn-helix domain-containing protein [Methylotenera sp.]|jgi:CRP/FNR family transcriptional regulator, anaerobic regulatory protein|nr:helix-turn-helix domain-containing protein [Methylotenera sp.]